MIVAWHGDPALKNEVAARMRQHREHDEIVQGLYQLINPNFASGYRGCLIGCTLPAQPVRAEDEIESFGVEGIEPVSPTFGWHGQVERLYGIPRPVGHLLDRIFEGLPCGDGKPAWFAVESIEAIPAGADLSMVPSHLMLEVLARRAHEGTPDDPRWRWEIEQVIDLYERRLSGDEPARQEWLNARSASSGPIGYNAAYAGAYPKSVEAFEVAISRAAFRNVDRDGWWLWVAARLIHHLAAAPIPVKI